MSEQTTIKHYGFTLIPRLVIRGERFKEMSLIERGLYVGIKDICGEDGECFYILRNLAKELHTSISTLSRYIPILKDYGLITAEKKCRGTGANKHEIWHIRVVNVWEENDALYKDCFTEKQKIVSQRNKAGSSSNFVSQRNRIVSDRNNGVDSQAQDCFYLNDIRRENNNLIEEESDCAAASAIDTTPFSFPLLETDIEAVTDETFKIAVMDDWREHKHLPKITPTIDVLSETLKRLQRNGTPSEDNPLNGQLTDETPALQTLQETRREATALPGKNSNVITPPASESTYAGTAKPLPENKQPPIAKETTGTPPESGTTEQPTLLERPKVPEMPPVTMKLSGEKIVQITEAFIGKYYPETRRQKQIAAARRIIAEGVTEEQYITAYVDMVDWWKQNQGVFHVFDMAANTKRGQMRVLEILERIEARQKPVNLDEKRNGVHKQAALTHGTQTRPYGLVSTEELHEDPWAVRL